MVRFYRWFKFYSPLFRTYYHTLPYPKTRENIIKTKDKIELEHMYNGKVHGFFWVTGHLNSVGPVLLFLEKVDCITVRSGFGLET